MDLTEFERFGIGLTSSIMVITFIQYIFIVLDVYNLYFSANIWFLVSMTFIGKEGLRATYNIGQVIKYFTHLLGYDKTEESQ